MLFSLLSSLVFDFKFRRANAIYRDASNVRPASSNHVSEDSEEGTLLRLKSKSDPHADNLHSDLGHANFSTVSAFLKKQLLHIKFLNGLGSGGFGCVFMAQFAGEAELAAEGQFFAMKFEFLKRGSDSALNREARVYIENSRANRDEVPLPKVCNVISGVRGGPRDCWASISLGPETTVNLLCIELLDIEAPKAIWKEGAKQLADNLVVTSSLRYLILEALHAQLYLLQLGIAHRDFKLPHHIGFRHENGQLVVFDFGMAEVEGFCYGTSVSRPTHTASR